MSRKESIRAAHGKIENALRLMLDQGDPEVYQHLLHEATETLDELIEELDGEEEEYDEPWSYEDRYEIDIDGVGFADPGGNSALRAATPDNPRIHDCPRCGRKRALTVIDNARGYVCDRCANAAERGIDHDYY